MIGAFGILEPDDFSHSAISGKVPIRSVHVNAGALQTRRQRFQRHAVANLPTGIGEIIASAGMQPNPGSVGIHAKIEGPIATVAGLKAQEVRREAAPGGKIGNLEAQISQGFDLTAHVRRP